ncbi:Peptide methionine sulfoxide reductase MsrA [Halomonadaceae bacterium LMG 33818]|uniref:peptide-methionine (S)-S-oxide reductase MsrA n=1 Tax=Cernens ardua TaxID=3402176 RepID=UPI003EDC52BB
MSKQTIPSPEQALPGRETPVQITGVHAVNGHSMLPPHDAGLEHIVLGMGCFWGAERLFWNLPGVVVTSVGYAAGSTPNPSYEEVCTGLTGHAEVVDVVYDPAKISLDQLLKSFWEEHDPTQGMRQGNDIGSQYRSIILTTNNDQYEAAIASKTKFNQALKASGMAEITTEIVPLQTYYFAEEYHQQYLHKNPAGYCGLKGTGVTCAIG